MKLSNDSALLDVVVLADAFDLRRRLLSLLGIVVVVVVVDAPVLDRVDTGGGYWHSAGPPGLFTYKLYKYYFRANRPVDHYETPGGKFQRIPLVALPRPLPFVHIHIYIRAHAHRILIVTFSPLNRLSYVPWNGWPLEIRSIA